MSPTTGERGLDVGGSFPAHRGISRRLMNHGDGHVPLPTFHASHGILSSRNSDADASSSRFSLKRTRISRFFDDPDLELRNRMEFFHKEVCAYTQEMYVKSGRIYSALKHESEEQLIAERRGDFDSRSKQQKMEDLARLEFETENEKRLTFDLAFSALKYQSLFEDIMDECSFFNYHPEMKEEEGLVMVILSEYQARKFQHRSPHPGESAIPLVTSVERAILDCKTKLNAALARQRIKASARSIECLLPESVRKNDEVRENMPAYYWVNQIKTSVDQVVTELKTEGYRRVAAITDASSDDDRVFCLDGHCPDLVVFPSPLLRHLQDSHLITEGQLVRQDKSSCLAPHSVKYLVNDDDDVIHVNAGSGITSAHIASLLKQTKSHVWAFGATGDADAYKIHKNMERLEVSKHVKIMSESFLEVEPDDSRFKSVRVVLVTASCSKSAVTNPVEFVVSEGEDMTILKDLSVGETDTSKIGKLMNEHTQILRHAMKFSKVQAVVYMTRSTHEAENENVVQKTVEYVNTIQQRRMPYRLIPPVLPFSAEDIENNTGIIGKYMKFQPSGAMNGCFVAVITREPEELKETAKDVIARATAKGLLGGKSPKTKSSESQNGDISDGVTTNGVYPQEKLLRKRSRKSSKRMRSSASVPVNHSFSPLKGNAIQQHLKSSPRLASKNTSRYGTNNSSTISRSASDHSRDEPNKIPEHVRVVRHPAPFR